MTETGAKTERPTPTALAAKAFLAQIDNETYRRAIETRAVLGGWVGARSAGLWDVKASDAVVMGALDALWDLFRGWAAECDDAEPKAGEWFHGTLPGWQCSHDHRHPDTAQACARREAKRRKQSP